MKSSIKLMRYYACPYYHKNIKNSKEKRMGIHKWRNHLKKDLRMELQETPVEFNKILKKNFGIYWHN